MGNDKADAVSYGWYGYQRHLFFMSIVYDGNALYRAFRRAQRSSPWKPQTHLFEMDFLHQLALLQKELRERTYRTSARTEFVLRERGKIRLIRSAPIRDRIVRHSFCDNVLEPALRPKLIYDNCASLKGKGIRMSRERLKVHLWRFFRKYRTNDGYILLMDYSGYYDNLRHDKLLEAVENVIGEEYAQWLLRLVLTDFMQDVSFLSDDEIRRYYRGRFRALDFIDLPKRLRTGEKMMAKSVDIGDQCSQILGVYFPTTIDQFIKTVRGEKFYGRYMDDSYVIAPSKAHLVELLDDVRKLADALGIILNDRKVRIVKLSRTFRFLQNRYFLTATGRVVERVNAKRVTVMRRKLKRLAVKVRHDSAVFEDVLVMFRSWRGTYYRLMSKAQRMAMDGLFYSLFREDLNDVPLPI